MKKNQLLFLAFLCFNAVFAQKNSLSIGVGRAFHTYDDLFTTVGSVRYERKVANRWNLGLELHATRQSYRGGPLNLNGYPSTTQIFEAEYSLATFRPLKKLAQYGTHSAEIFYLSTDLGASYRLWHKHKHSLNAGFGVSLTYVDYRRLHLLTVGKFSSFADEYITLVVPSYDRFLDIGANGFLCYQFHFNDRTAIAARLSHRQLHYSSEFYTSAEAMFSVKF